MSIEIRLEHVLPNYFFSNPEEDFISFKILKKMRSNIENALNNQVYVDIVSPLEQILGDEGDYIIEEFGVKITLQGRRKLTAGYLEEKINWRFNPVHDPQENPDILDGCLAQLKSFKNNRESLNAKGKD